MEVSMPGFRDLFKGKRCVRCDGKLQGDQAKGPRETQICDKCRKQEVIEEIGRSYKYQDEVSSKEPTRKDLGDFEVVIKPVGIFSDSNVAMQTARACPMAKKIAWANLDGRGKGHMVVEGMSKDIPGGLEGRSPVLDDDGEAFGYIINLSDAGLAGDAVALVTKTSDRAANTILDFPCDHATDLTLGPSGSTIALVTWAGQHPTVHVNQNTFGPFDGMATKVEHPISLSRDGQHYGFFVHHNEEEFAIIDAEKLGPYEAYRDPPVFSDTGKRFAYDVKIDGRACIVDTGQKGDLYDFTMFGPCVDPGGSHVAYGAVRGEKCHIVMDGQTVDSFKDARAFPRLSPDGKRMLKVILRGDRFAVRVDDKLLNTHEQPEQVVPPTIAWSPDSSRVGYLCGSEDERYLMVDKERIGPIDDLRMPGIVFSPDSRHYAAIVKTGTEYQVMIDGKLVDYEIYFPVEALAFTSPISVRLAEVDILNRQINWIEIRAK
jgi:hypothetical protein